ncbi:MAG: FKBP-type peptidyl-prolyl cis-trans isomerase [Actinomycetota bacterium]
MSLRFALAVLCCLLLLASCSGSAEVAEGCEERPVESDTGLRYEDLECGRGEEAEGGTSVTITYVAELEDGTRFASSEDQGGEFVFPLGRGQVISGLDEGVRGMKVGGARRLTIPPDIAYGDAGFPPDVDPGETVVYEVELLGVEDNS